MRQKSPHPNQHQSSNPLNHNISQAYMNEKKFAGDEEHCRRKWKLNHNKIGAEKSCDHHQNI